MSKPLCSWPKCTRLAMVGLERCYKHVGLRSTSRRPPGTTRPRRSVGTIQLGLRLPGESPANVTITGPKVPELLEALKRAGLVRVVCVGCGAEGLARPADGEIGKRCPRCDAAARAAATAAAKVPPA